MMPNIFMPSFETAYSSRTGAMCRSEEGVHEGVHDLVMGNDLVGRRPRRSGHERKFFAADLAAVRE